MDVNLKTNKHICKKKKKNCGFTRLNSLILPEGRLGVLQTTPLLDESQHETQPITIFLKVNVTVKIAERINALADYCIRSYGIL